MVTKWVHESRCVHDRPRYAQRRSEMTWCISQRKGVMHGLGEAAQWIKRHYVLFENLRPRDGLNIEIIESKADIEPDHYFSTGSLSLIHLLHTRFKLGLEFKVSHIYLRQRKGVGSCFLSPFWIKKNRVKADFWLLSQIVSNLSIFWKIFMEGKNDTTFWMTW